MNNIEIDLNIFDDLSKPVILLKADITDSKTDFYIKYLNNFAAKTLELNVKDALNKSFAEVITDFAESEFYKKLLKINKEKNYCNLLSYTIQINAKFYIYNISVLPAEDLLLIFDRANLNGQMLRDSEADTSHVHIINTICKSVAESALNYRSVLKTIVNLVADYQNALCFLRIISNDKKTLNSVEVSHPNPDIKKEAEEFFANYIQETNKGLNSYVIKNNAPLIIPEINDETLKQIPEQYIHYIKKGNVKSLVIFPLSFENDVIGTMTLAREAGKPKFSQRDIKFLEEISTIASLSISNAKLYNEKITELKYRIKTENRLKIILEKLEESNKNLQDFAYITSHDLQEPLRMISSFTKLLSKKMKSTIDNDTNEFMFFILDATQRMQKMIQGILSYSRVYTKGNPFEKVNLNKIFENICDNLRVLIDETSAKVIIPKLPEVYADEVQMIQLFQNLIENSIKFKKENVKPIVKIVYNYENHNHYFSVEDNGIGIENNSSEKIFILFQKLHEAGRYTGSGIGLAICKRIVERHNGKIWLDENYNEGSKINIIIPERIAEN